VVVRHSRWVAMVPFGAGQFQNGQEGLGYAFLLAESALAATSIASAAIEMGLISTYSRSTEPIDFLKFESQLETAYEVKAYSSTALLVVALAGIIHAQATFVPEVVEQRTRPLPPPPPTLTPKIGGGPSGFFLGVTGRF